MTFSGVRPRKSLRCRGGNEKRSIMIYPKIPVTFWGFDHILSFIGKKASIPPLGLLTVGSLIPSG